jgi:hypothetical protein
MHSPFVHNMISTVLSFSIAWHCIVGCCGHHAHAHTNSGTHTCGQTHDSNVEITRCGHHGCNLHCESDQNGSDTSSEQLRQPSGSVHCLGGKCAFASGESNATELVGSGMTSDLDCHFADLLVSNSWKVCKRAGVPMAFSWPCATGTRLQQIFCAWRC